MLSASVKQTINACQQTNFPLPVGTSKDNHGIYLGHGRDLARRPGLGAGICSLRGEARGPGKPHHLRK
jgi:hypothetical protein